MFGLFEMTFRRFLVLIFFIFKLNFIALGRILPSIECSSPAVCTDVFSCEDSTYNFMTYSVKRIYCGFSGNLPKICCLPKNATTRAHLGRGFKENSLIIYHKNFELLRWDICGVISSRLRIISGTSTSPGEFPWMTLIAYRKAIGNSTASQDFKCGGTLINDYHVLTAAHCIDKSTIFGVRLGEYNLLTRIDCDSNGQNCEPPVQDRLIDEIIIHPFYDPLTFINDIALIRLVESANFSYGNVKPICLPFGELLDLDLVEKNLVVAGWGATEHESKSMILKKVSVPVMSLDKCQKIYENLKPITKKQICAGADHGRDSCAGDSGGPLKRIDFIDNSPRYVQYGIVSFGPTDCGISNRPGIYTNLQKYMRWILDSLA